MWSWGWSQQNRMMTLPVPSTALPKVNLKETNWRKTEASFYPSLHPNPLEWVYKFSHRDPWEMDSAPINMHWSCDYFGQCSDSGGGGSLSLRICPGCSKAWASLAGREMGKVSQAFQSTARGSATNPIHSDYRWMREVSGDQELSSWAQLTLPTHRFWTK